MEILPTRPQCLTLEARHTISLQVSKQRSLKVARSLFLPRHFPKQDLPIFSNSIHKEPSKEETTMNSKSSYSNDQNKGIPASSPSTNVPTNVITYFTEIQPQENSKTIRAAIAKIESTAKKSSPPKKALKSNRTSQKNEQRSKSKSQSSNKELSTTSTVTTTNCHIPDIPPDLNSYSNNCIIEISSDEEDTKPFIRFGQPSSVQANPVSVPVQSSPFQSIPMESTPTQNFPNMYTGNYQPQYQQQQYPPPQNIYPRASDYPPPVQCMQGFYQAPVNYQPGFYSQSYPSSRPLTISMPNIEIRYQPYQAIQRSNTGYHSQIQQPVPELPPQISTQFPANHSTSLVPVDVSKWQPPPKYPFKPVNHPQMNYTPVSRLPMPQQQQALVPLSDRNEMHAFYERLNEIYSSGHRRSEIPTASPSAFWSPNNAPPSFDYAMAMMRENGNTWPPSQAMVRKRIENNPGPVNHMVSQPSHPIPLAHPNSRLHADSTTRENLTSSPTNLPQGVFISNISPFNQRYPFNNPSFYNQELSKPPQSYGTNPSRISPTLNQLTLNDDIPEGFYRNVMNLPEYDPRDNR